MSGGWWHGVRDRIRHVAETPGSDELFAGFAHRFTLEMPLTEGEVEEAEELCGSRLPDEYRAFLVQVSAGGAGPAYGLFFPLRRMADGWKWVADDTHRTAEKRISEPFTPQHINGVPIDPLELRPPAQYDFEYRDDYQAAHTRWQETLWHPDRTAGAICLSDEGCLRANWLVVTGDERGMMWRDYRIDGMDLSPLFDAEGNRLTFSRWYLNWLGATENHIRYEPRGQRGHDSGAQ